MNIFVQSSLSEPERRSALYRGTIFLDSGRPALSELADHARAIVREYFSPYEPATAQFSLPVDAFIERASSAKTKFTNDPLTKQLLVAVLAAEGANLASTYFDVPRLRVVTAQNYLTAGVGYAYRPHRDTWYAAPTSQINWWAPLGQLLEQQALVFYPRYFAREIANTSSTFDYEEWQREGRPLAKSQVTSDSRNHPLPLTSLDEDEELRFVTPADSVVRFSAAMLHATAANTSAATRFSIDFRTFDLADLECGRGALNGDGAARGTTTADFLCAQTLQPYTRRRPVAAHG